MAHPKPILPHLNIADCTPPKALHRDPVDAIVAIETDVTSKTNTEEKGEEEEAQGTGEELEEMEGEAGPQG